MKRKIPCPCDNSFDVEVPDEINLDTDSEIIDEIMDGSFMNYTCPSCEKKHKPEFPLTVVWPSKKVRYEVLPETERGQFYRRKKDPPDTETLISYPEMAERIAMLRDGLEPAVVEALKYYVLVKAEENYPDREITMWYQNRSPDALEYHLMGIRDDEVAVSRIPAELYEKKLAEYKKHPKSELFNSLRIRNYLSIQNIMRPEELL
ncbi:CpXC domain-containing protein [Breznakiella homolactica]|uniref:CpXC domain-containing protein n=1 Tax=Breznakiella homolactica TaxID=2798577 RepID=A0A7T7XKS3_9SPIR|nr:CpXC domain-containing protein [Breznakiella homolactica]QQO08082.1 CpXC domain-containing protein [Breznakiella homolactica]